MRATRRWFLVASGAMFAMLFPRKAKASSEGKKCTVRLFDVGKNPLRKFGISIRSLRGVTTRGFTDVDGKYEFTALEDSTYSIQVREPILQTVVSTFMHLTPAEIQELSVSIQSAGTYTGIFNALQGIESMIVNVVDQNGNKGMDDKTLSLQLSKETLIEILREQVTRVSNQLEKLDTKSVSSDLLKKKAETLDELLRRLN